MPPGAWRSPRSGEEWVPDAWLLIGSCSADVTGGIAVAGACCSKSRKSIRLNFLDKIQKIIPLKFSGLFTVSCILRVYFLEFFHNYW